jgi:hypothetical protein
MIHLQVTVDNTTELLDPNAYGAGALLRWESSADPNGPYVEGGTLGLNPGQSVYDVWDSNGTTLTWYRTRTSNSGGTSFSAYSDIAPLTPSGETFTYDASTDAGKVRLLCQDFDASEMIFSDKEIQAFLDLNEADVRWAAAQALEVIASNEVYVQKRIKLLDLTTDGPAEAAQLMKLAASLRGQAVMDSESIDDLFDYAEQAFNHFSSREIIRNSILRGY